MRGLIPPPPQILVIQGITADCNTNGLFDGCDLAGVTSQDCNTNGVPDECEFEDLESDFDGDGLIDVCDPDIDDDGISNEADVCDFTPPGATVQPNGTLRMDGDGDCDVDLVDFGILQDEYTGAFGMP